MSVKPGTLFGPMSAQQARRVDLNRHLFFRLPDVISYLFVPSLWMALLGLAIFSAVMRSFGAGIFGIFPVLLAVGIEIGFFFQITRSSANGDKRFSAPEFDNIYDSIVQPILLVLVAALPILVALYWATLSIFSGYVALNTLGHGPLILILVGILLFPLLLTVAAIDGTIGGVLNPSIWGRALLGLKSNYLVAGIAFYGLWFLEGTFFASLALELYQLPVFGISVLVLLVGYIPRVLRYRLLGALCEPFIAGPYVPELAQATVVSTEQDDSYDRLAELQAEDITPRAILRMANTAYSKGQYRLVYRAVEKLWTQHRDSPEVVHALWLAAQIQEKKGEFEAMRATLHRIISHHEQHPMASEARLKLRQYEAQLPQN